VIRIRAGLGFDFWQGQGKSLFATASRPALVHIQPPIRWVPGLFSWDRAAGVWSWPLTSI